MPDLDPMALRSAFGSFMTGVTIVTARAPDGKPVGFTANSFTSVSMNPPLILVCPGSHLSSFRTFENCEYFAVNILGENQQDISDVFAAAKENRFAFGEWQPDKNGVPILAGAIANFSCSTHQSVVAGDHLVLIGKVEAFSKSEGLGLGYWKGGYFSLSREREARASSSSDEPIMVGAIVETPDGICAFQDDNVFCLPTVELSSNAEAREGIESHLATSGLAAEIGRVYSLYHDAVTRKRFIYFRAHAKKCAETTNLIILPFEDVSNVNWLHGTEATMVKRFLAERNNNQFGLYIGDSNAGEVHHETPAH